MTSTNNKVDTDPAEAPDKGVGCGALVSRPNVRPLRDLWAIIDPNGNIVHTMLALTSDAAIEMWMEQEREIVTFFTGHPAPSWEGYEAEGYRTARVDLLPANKAGQGRP